LVGAIPQKSNKGKFHAFGVSRGELIYRPPRGSARIKNHGSGNIRTKEKQIVNSITRIKTFFLMR
jgi:hypothetical protein